MEWEEFYQSILHEGHFSDPGRHLFGIVLHDSLGCLNNFKECYKLALATPNASQKLKAWFSEWIPTVSIWIDNLNSYWEYDEKTTSSHHIWAKNIEKISQIFFDVHTIAADIRAFDKPTKGEEKDIVETAVKNIQCLETIKSNIRSQEYMSLWKRTHLKNN